MQDPEKHLQDQLNALEHGQDLESILQGLPADAQEFAPLLQLASQIKQISHPEPSTAQAVQQQQKVSAAARDHFAKRRAGWKLPQLSWTLTGSFVGALVLVLAIIGVAAAGSWAVITMNNWTTVEVIEAAGVVQVASLDQPESWRTIQSGERMREGERIRSSADGIALLRFSDGSLITVSPSTDLNLIQVERGWDGHLSVVLIQYAGETQHDVSPLKNSNSVYRVHTPSGTASVRGTSFEVVVDQLSGKALFTVSEGSVWVESGGEDVVLDTGQETITQPNMEPEDPAYGFHIKGILGEWDADSIVIGDIQLNVSEGMMVGGKPIIGKMARAAGHIDENGVWWADLLTSSGGKFQASFNGILEATGETSWQVSGKTVLIDDNTKLSGVMLVGDPVKVDFVVLDDGQYLATHIRPLDDDDDITPTPSVTTTITPDLTQTATATATITPTPTETITGTVVPTDTNCTGADPHPTGLTLAERYNVTYEEIMGWFCSGYGFGEIDLAYGWSLEYGVPVNQIFAMREAGEGWGNIKKYLEATATVTPEDKLKEDKVKKEKKDNNNNK